MAELGIASLEELAERCGSDKGNLSRTFRQQQRPRVDALEPLATGLHVGVYEILVRIGAVDPENDIPPVVTKTRRRVTFSWPKDRSRVGAAASSSSSRRWGRPPRGRVKIQAGCHHVGLGQLDMCDHTHMAVVPFDTDSGWSIPGQGEWNGCFPREIHVSPRGPCPGDSRIATLAPAPNLGRLRSAFANIVAAQGTATQVRNVRTR